MTTPLLEVRGLHAGYGAAEVLFGIDLAVAPGEIVGVLGRNGMGKTTLVRTIMGLLRAARGHDRASPATRSPAGPPHRIARAGIGLVPEGRQVFPNLSVDEHLDRVPARPRRAARQPGRRRACSSSSRRWPSARAHLGNQLSGGEQQMLAIGRALVTNPRLLILDEATEGLAPLVREEIWRASRQLRDAGLAMIVIDKYVQRLVAHRRSPRDPREGPRRLARQLGRARRGSLALAPLPRRLARRQPTRPTRRRLRRA